jgi:tRNA(Ile)-lysidine synthase
VHVATDRAAAAPDLAQTVGEVLDRRLSRDSQRRIVVALSGGGDSLALLLAAHAWAKRAGRELLVLTVDHRLRPQSAQWTQACGTTAERLGLAFSALAWTGEKPTTGLPAAARAARHALLADAARDAGARVILMGHTADDGLEARVMRAAGSTTPEAREWAPSPAWPQGRGLFLLRPMVSLRRADIRDWLRARGERWIEDPTNEDLAYARPRARQALARGACASAAMSSASAAALALTCRPEPGGGFALARADLRTADTEILVRFVSAVCLCAAGTARPPSRERVERLAARLTENARFVATLAGARIDARATEVRFLREAGEAARGGLAPLRLAAEETGIWDGRFEIKARRAVEIQAAARTTLPVATRPDGSIEAVDVTPLTLDRLLAACGAIEREPG